MVLVSSHCTAGAFHLSKKILPRRFEPGVSAQIGGAPDLTLYYPRPPLLGPTQTENCSDHDAQVRLGARARQVNRLGGVAGSRVQQRPAVDAKY